MHCLNQVKTEKDFADLGSAYPVTYGNSEKYASKLSSFVQLNNCSYTQCRG